MGNQVLDEIVWKLKKDRDEINDQMEQLSIIQARRYELTLGNEQDSLGEIRKDSLQIVEAVEEKQDSLDGIITEMKAEGYQFEESNTPGVEQPEKLENENQPGQSKLEEQQDPLDEIIQDMKDSGCQFEETNALEEGELEKIAGESEKEEIKEDVKVREDYER